MKKLYTLALVILSFASAQAAELFVRVNSASAFSASAYNQSQTNPMNIFRFFELPGGSVLLQVKDQYSGVFLYNQYISIPAGNRIVAEIDVYGNLSIVQNYPIQVTNWYCPVPCTGAYTPPVTYPGGNNQTAGSVSDPNFQQFLVILEKESFDSNKLETAKKYASKSSLSAQQITEISRKFTFDSNRLDWAKYAYAYCFDKGNYFLLKSTFQFSSSYSDLEDYIEKQ